MPRGRAGSRAAAALDHAPEGGFLRDRRQQHFVFVVVAVVGFGWEAASRRSPGLGSEGLTRSCCEPKKRLNDGRERGDLMTTLHMIWQKNYLSQSLNKEAGELPARKLPVFSIIQKASTNGQQ